MQKTICHKVTVHQTFSEWNALPAVWKQASERLKAWCAATPGWEYMFWSDADLFQMLEDKYAWFVPRYQMFQDGPEKAAAAKPFIMHTHGGIMLDCDYRVRTPSRLLDLWQYCKHTTLSCPLQPGYDRSTFVVTNHIHAIKRHFCISLAPGAPYWPTLWKYLQAPTTAQKTLAWVSYVLDVVRPEATVGDRLWNQAAQQCKPHSISSIMWDFNEEPQGLLELMPRPLSYPVDYDRQVRKVYQAASASRLELISVCAIISFVLFILFAVLYSQATQNARI